MNEIPLMNVSRQYKNIKQELNESVLSVLESGSYIMGSHVKRFEIEFAEYIGVNYAVSVGNGTDALVIALKAAGIQPGDEVITCAMSFFATAEAVAILGATPVFVDCTEDTYTIDTDKIEKKITDKTRAIIPVHLYGQCADMNKILELAEKYSLTVIEDAAQAAGAEYYGKKAGSMGNISCFSFFPTKNLGCAGDGGMILTNDPDLATRCRAYRLHGSGKDGQTVYNSVPGNCDYNDFSDNPPKYYNFVSGYNSRLDEIQAAILRIKLKYLEDWNDRRIELADRYNHLLKNPVIVKPSLGKGNKHIYYTYIIKTDSREKLKKYLEENHVTTGTYFPVPLHLQKAFDHLNYKEGDMPNSEEIAGHSLALPMFAELTEKEQDQVINLINNFR